MTLAIMYFKRIMALLEFFTLNYAHLDHYEPRSNYLLFNLCTVHLR